MQNHVTVNLKDGLVLLKTYFNMGIYLILGSVSTFIIGLCKVLNLGKLIRLWQHKKLHPKATLKEIENFEKNTKINYIINWNKKNDV